RVARRLGVPVTGFDFAHPSEIFDEMAGLWPAIAGLSYPRLESGGIQWTCPTPDHPGTRFLYAEDFSTGSDRFVRVSQGATAAELADTELSFVRNWGRVRYQ